MSKEVKKGKTEIAILVLKIISAAAAATVVVLKEIDSSKGDKK